jgi:hypothetical protein
MRSALLKEEERLANNNSRLSAIIFVQARERKWDAQYLALKDFKAKHGTLR